MSSYQTVTLEHGSGDAEGIATLTLNRPKAANTISRQLISDVNAALDELEKDKTTRVLLVTGAGERHFCGGADLRDLGGSAAERAGGARRDGGGEAVRPANRRGADRGFDFITHFEHIPQPVIAVINGAAMGGGCEIAIACDFRVMASEAKIGVPEIQFGALPAGGGTQRLPRIVGLARAKDLVLTGRHLTAQEALEIGLVHRIAPRAQLMDEARALAAELADKAGYALATGKKLLNGALDMPLEQGLALEGELTRTMGSPEEVRAARERAMKKSKTYDRIFSKSESSGS